MADSVSIKSITDDGSGNYEVSLRCSRECDAEAMSQQLKRGQLRWKELECDNSADAFRLEMIKKMAPPPRCKFVLEMGEDQTDEISSRGGAESMYFDAYGDMEVHELMLRDRPRMEAYSAAIEHAKDQIAGKAVLDVGTGTGVLAMLAAKAGARVVYAVEASSAAQLAQELVEANQLSETVRVLHSSVEDVELPEKVDVVISEWMGFYLLHESMLGSVLFARDRWLKPGGLMLPGGATIHACPVAWERGREEHVVFWQNYHGLDFSAIGQRTLGGMAGRPLVEDVAPADLLCEPLRLLDLDLHTVSPEELQVVEGELPFTCKADAKLAGVALWFECRFGAKRRDTSGEAAAALGKRGRDAGGDEEEEVVLSTAPTSGSTHWKQTTVLFGDFFDVAEGEAMPMRLRMQQDPDNPRTYALSVHT